MFRRLGYSLQRFMYGRYGSDQLNLALLILGFLISIIAQLCGIPLIGLVSYVPYAYCIYRMLSRKVDVRRRENAFFMKYWSPVRSIFTKGIKGLVSWAKFRTDAFKQRKTYRYFRCPKCGQYLRAPRGRGKIEVTCRKCSSVFVKKV